MLPPVLVAGLDGRSLLLEISVLQRGDHVIDEQPTARGLLVALAETGSPLVVLGPRLPDMALAELVGRIRSSPGLRAVSILVLIPAAEPEEVEAEARAAGANVILRRPLQQQRVEASVARLLAVPRRIEARVPVLGQVIGRSKASDAGRFSGLSRNISINGMLLASPAPLPERPEVELEFALPNRARFLRALGRVVREAKEVAWPYRGYGVEFLFTPPDSLEAIAGLVQETGAQAHGAAAAPAIHATLQREAWIYEILEPTQDARGWQSEIRRGPREDWSPGRSGPFYVVDGQSREEALARAHDFVLRHG